MDTKESISNETSPDFDINQYQGLRQSAIAEVSHRFYEKYPSLIDSYGPRGMEATQEDIGFTLDFLRPAVEYGHTKSFVDYLVWLSDVLSSRGVPVALIWNMLEWLAEFFDSNLRNEFGARISEILRSSLHILKSSQAANFLQIDNEMPEAWPDVARLQQALLDSDLAGAKKLFHSHLRAGKNFLDIELHLLQPALYQIGKDWQQNKVTVAQEHLATATAITLMAEEFSRAPKEQLNGKKVLCACVAGNNHAVGMRMIADALSIKGWSVIFLGEDVPIDKIIKQVQLNKPHLLCLSLSMPDHLRAAKLTINKLRDIMGNKSPAIMVGGLAINAYKTLSDAMKADQTAANALHAVEIASSLHD